jgi:hypothetical protein
MFHHNLQSMATATQPNNATGHFFAEVQRHLAAALLATQQTSY